MNMDTTIDKEISQKLQPELFKQVVEMLDTSIDATIEIRNLFSDEKYDVANQLLEDIHSMMESLNSHTEVLANERKHSLAKELYENIQDTLEDINMAINNGNHERALEKIEFQLLPFIRNIRESFYFWGLIYPDKEKMDKYYKEEFANNYRNYYVREDGEYEYTLSIVIPAYNHLDVTKRCVEQLLKVTDLEKLNAELILLNHGSNDGTLEYFEKLNVGKVVHFKNNVRMYMFTNLMEVCKGKYFALVSNDVLVTRNWAEILLKCLESDERIIAAVPTTPNICNLQMINVPTYNPDEFIDWANNNNKSDPLKWNDRARIMPPVCCYRTNLVNKVGYADPLFYSMEFWDDDFSLRARRGGYRQIVCDDVACYHFGSVTGKEFQKKERTLDYGKNIFIYKHNVNAWGNGFCYDDRKISLMKEKLLNIDGDINVLGIDCGFGDSLLQIKNEMRHINKECITYHINSQYEYHKDASTTSDNCINVNNILNGIESGFNNILFDAIWIEQGLENYDDIENMFKLISKSLKDGGRFVAYCTNPYNIMNLIGILNFNLPDGQLKLKDYGIIQSIVNKYFNKVVVIAIAREIEVTDEFIKKYYSEIKDISGIKQKLSIEKYYFVCDK